MNTNRTLSNRRAGIKPLQAIAAIAKILLTGTTATFALLLLTSTVIMQLH